MSLHMSTNTVHSLWMVNRFSTFTDYFGSKESYRNKSLLGAGVCESFKQFLFRFFDCFGCLTMIEMKKAEKQSLKETRIEYMELEGLNLCKKGCQDHGRNSVRSSLENLEDAWSQMRGMDR